MSTLFKQGTGGVRSGSPLSEAQLRRVLERDGVTSLFHFLKFAATRDAVVVFDDFTGKALDVTNNWNVAAGAQATTWAINAQENGVIRGVTGTTAATSGLQLFGTHTMLQPRNMGMEIRFKVDVITELRLEMGFVNALPAVNTTIGNNLTTPTLNTTAQAVIYLYDNASATTTSGLYTKGSTAAAAKLATTTNRPVADTYQTVRIETQAGFAHLWVDGKLLVSRASAIGIDPTDALIFALSVKSSDTNSKNIDVDYVRTYADRK